MTIRDRLLEFEERLKQLAGEPPPREPLEVRQAILHGIVDLARPAGRGGRVMPFDRVDVEVLASSPELRRVFEAVFARDEGLEASARRALLAVSCDPGPRFGVVARYRRRPPAGWSTDQVFAIAGRVETPARHEGPIAPAQGPSATRGAVPTVILRLMKGRAARRTLQLQSERINIGRQEEVADRDRRLVRRNHFVFVEGDEVSATVSRAHAHIRCAASGECRLRDDASAYGTRIVREGRTIEVDAGNSRGVRLQTGDELHLGRAVIRFEIPT